MPDPTKKRLITEDEIKRCQTYYGLGLTIADMSALVGVSKATFERRINDQPELLEALLKGKAQADAQVTQSLFKQAISGKNTAATIFWLKCRKGWKEAEFSSKEDKDYDPPETLKLDDDKAK